MPVGGVQTWSKTVGDELLRLGHEVFYWGPEWKLPAGQFDFGVFANLKSTKQALGLCDSTVKVSHGIIPDEKGGPEFVATSEEVRDKWGCRAILRQPLDLSFWTPDDSPKTLFTRHSYRRGLDFLPAIANEWGLEFRHLRKDSPEAVRDALRRSRVVVATGRAAVEAMACGASVVIADDREYQGALLDPDPIGAMTRNYSGRAGRSANRSEMQMAVGKAVQRGSLRAHVEANHDAHRIVQELLCLRC